MKGKIRWKMQEKPSGLSAVGAGPRGYDLHDGKTHFASVYAHGGDWRRPFIGWYWVSFVDGAHKNTSGNPIQDVEQAKKEAREFVINALKEQEK